MQTLRPQPWSRLIRICICTSLQVLCVHSKDCDALIQNTVSQTRLHIGVTWDVLKLLMLEPHSQRFWLHPSGVWHQELGVRVLKAPQMILITTKFENHWCRDAFWANKMFYRKSYHSHLHVNYINQLMPSPKHLFPVIQSEEVVALAGKEEKVVPGRWGSKARVRT